MNPCEVTVHAQKKKKKRRRKRRREETRNANGHIISSKLTYSAQLVIPKKLDIGSVWIELIVAENLKLKTEN